MTPTAKRGRHALSSAATEVAGASDASHSEPQVALESLSRGVGSVLSSDDDAATLHHKRRAAPTAAEIMFGNSQLSTFVSTNSALPGSEENDMVGKSDTTNSSASQLPADAVTVEDRIKRIAQCYRTIIECIGENPDRPGLVDTPERAAKAMLYMCSGYSQTASGVVGRGVFEEETRSNVVLVRDIDVFSLCEHHMLPFIGKVSIAYIPNKRILGLSKLARIANVFARRMQVQERLTEQILNAINDIAQPLGVAVYFESKHLCMCIRGVEKNDSFTVTTAYTGCYLTDPSLKDEFLSSMGHRR